MSKYKLIFAGKWTLTLEKEGTYYVSHLSYNDLNKLLLEFNDNIFFCDFSKTVYNELLKSAINTFELTESELKSLPHTRPELFV